jgi:hypothetical protein
VSIQGLSVLLTGRTISITTDAKLVGMLELALKLRIGGAERILDLVEDAGEALRGGAASVESGAGGLLPQAVERDGVAVEGGLRVGYDLPHVQNGSAPREGQTEVRSKPESQRQHQRRPAKTA